MPTLEIFTNLGISLGLGLLVGLQRERAASQLAGFRTFALITLLGTIAGLLAQTLGVWIVVAGLLGVAVSFAAGNLAFAKKDEPNPGITTEIAALIMFCVGAYLVLGQRSVAVAIAGATAVLLWAKPILHGLVKKIGDDEIKAMMQLTLIALVILPILPDKAYGPFQVLNPRQIWWMV
ncbi:MAG TPA: MgtC/SapB family protein, partial [Phycisphaerales bacterium]|nr:MgtC/SapB family protein [Phycisphaerales bacterium]